DASSECCQLDQARIVTDAGRLEHADDAMAPGVNQGVAAELKPRREWSLRELLDKQPSLLVALDSIMDPQNLGAILRSAEVAGADGAIVPSTAAPRSRPQR